jgi:hypothetical protein
VRWVTDVGLEPISAPLAARKRFKSIVKELAARARGAIEDPQEGTVELPSGAKRYAAPPRGQERISLLSLNYWFVDSPVHKRSGRATLIDYLARHMPEALPRRYGRSEPPQHRWDPGGRERFLDFLDSQGVDYVVIYPSKPCLGFHLCPIPSGWVRWGARRLFRCGYLQLQFDSRAMHDPAWHNALRSAWLDVAAIVQPFATNVEILANYIEARATIRSDAKTEWSACSPWWAGIPARLGLALALDERYTSAWPTFAARTSAAGPLHFVSLVDWRKSDDLTRIVGTPPEDLLERPGRGWSIGADGYGRFEAAPGAYPAFFPFPDAG